MSPLSDRSLTTDRETARHSRNEAAREYLDAGARDRLLRWVDFVRAFSLPIANMETTQ